MTVQEDPRAAARRIVEEVLADHAARSATPAAPTPVERTSTVPPPPQAIPAAPIAATSHPDTVAWRTARRIVDEVLAAHASAPPGDTLVADPPNVVADGSAPIDSLEVPTLLIDVSDQSTEVAVVSEAASPLPTDGIPEELFAGHIIVSEADGDEPTATAPTVEPPAEPEVEPVPDDPDPVPVDPDPVPVDPDPVPVDPDPVPVDPEPEPLEPQPVPIDSDVGKARAVAPDATARPFSTEAASVASRIVAEVLADHAERDAAAAEAQAAGTTAQLPTATQEVPARHDAPEPDGPPPIPAVAGPTLPADPAAVGAVLTDAPPPLADEVETRDATLDLDEVPGPRRTGRWLMTTIVGAVALALLFPLAVRALRELISLG